MMTLLFYFITFFIVFILNIIGSNYYDKNKLISKICILLGFLILLFLFGLRFNVGTDYEAYLKYYELIKITPWNNLDLIKWEPGAIYTFKIFSTIFNNNYMIFFVLGFLTLFPIYKVNKIYNYKYLAYSILTYCFIFIPFCMNGMRQGIAMSFILLAFTYLLNNKKRYFILSFLIAFLFHESSILFLPYALLYIFFKNFNYKKITIITTVVISCIILFFFKDLLQIESFDNYKYLLNNINVNNLSYTLVLFYVPIIIIMLIFKTKNIEFDKLKSVIYSGIIFDIVGTAARYLSRISLYFTIFEIILIPHLIQNIQEKNIRFIIKILFIIFLMLYFYIEYYFYGRHEILPYKSWIN